MTEPPGEGLGLTEEQPGEVPDAPTPARQRHAELAADLTEHLYRYHVLDAPVISDGE